ncbi:12453_t:CDS:2 [Funneliformis caledonium]|uniref:12453_t:CDS:1 n=1 Tax=Funneliformis caledonium TaxID=1117310 RepID=A0A9N8ZEY2_9GLOM|nr:12453_t:CDS:2 [Funneliformis caledonium]
MDNSTMSYVISNVISPFELELDWTSPLVPKSNSPLLGIGQGPIPTLTITILIFLLFILIIWELGNTASPFTKRKLKKNYQDKKFSKNNFYEKKKDPNFRTINSYNIQAADEQKHSNP